MLNRVMADLIDTHPPLKMIDHRNAFLITVLLVAVSGIKSTTAQSRPAEERRSTTGIFIYPSVSTSVWTADEFDIDQENGGGSGIGFGYGFSNRFALFINLIGATINQKGTRDTYSLDHLDVGARATLGRPSSPLKYIIDVMVSGINSENAFPKPEVEVEGRMYSVGAGVQYFVLKEIALQAHATAGAGTFNQFKLDGEQIELNTFDRAFRTTRFSLSVVWFASQ